MSLLQVFHAAAALASAVMLALAGYFQFVWEPTEIDPKYAALQFAHMLGTCGGGFKPGTGLLKRKDGSQRGWIFSMVPGIHEFRVRGSGRVFVGPEGNETTTVMNSGTYALITVDGPGTLEWRTPGSKRWEKVDVSFLYPGSDDIMQRAMDRALKDGLVVPGLEETFAELKDPKRIDPPEEWPGALMRKYGNIDPSPERRRQVDAQQDQ